MSLQNPYRQGENEETQHRLYICQHSILSHRELLIINQGEIDILTQKIKRICHYPVNFTNDT